MRNGSKYRRLTNNKINSISIMPTSIQIWWAIGMQESEFLGIDFLFSIKIFNKFKFTL